MKPFSIFVCLTCLLASSAFGQSSVSVTVGAAARRETIPKDFSGLSFETESLRPNVHGVKGYLFEASNTELVRLFRELGIKNLRIGGETVDDARISPTRKDIDALFRFAKAAGVKVIYSLRLLNGNPKEDASTAKYIWDNYRKYLDCFAIGNEPDRHSYHLSDPHIYETIPEATGSAFPTYFTDWMRFAEAILDSVHGAPFTGPDAGSNFPVPRAKDTSFHGMPWTVNFADYLAQLSLPHGGYLAFVDQHNFVGQDAREEGLTPQKMIDRMLSPLWVSSYYPALYDGMGTPALPRGVGYRLTESNSFGGGVRGGSDCFATALFALDYMHWWAEHNCLGVNFDNAQWKYNGTIYLDREGNYEIHPIGYGIKAFDIGGHGEIESVSITNPDTLDLTAYAVDDSGTLYVTLINKEHGEGASKTPGRSAKVRVGFTGFSGRASAVYLRAPHNDPAATSGITLGGAAITSTGPWRGKWEPLRGRNVGKRIHTGSYEITVAPSSAAVIRIGSGGDTH